MEIEFNPGRYSDSGASQPAARRVSTPSTPDSGPSLERTHALQQSLRDASQVRPEVVSRARALVDDAQYPPDEVLNRIATLLAMKIK